MRSRRKPWRRYLTLLKIRDKMICQLCFTLIRKGELSVDHIVPRSKGGSHNPENLQLAHKRCNTLKGSKT